MKIMLHEQEELEKAAALNKWKDASASAAETTPASADNDATSLVAERDESGNGARAGAEKHNYDDDDLFSPQEFSDDEDENDGGALDLVSVPSTSSSLPASPRSFYRDESVVSSAGATLGSTISDLFIRAGSSTSEDFNDISTNHQRDINREDGDEISRRSSGSYADLDLHSDAASSGSFQNYEAETAMLADANEASTSADAATDTTFSVSDDASDANDSIGNDSEANDSNDDSNGAPSEADDAVDGEEHNEKLHLSDGARRLNDAASNFLKLLDDHDIKLHNEEASPMNYVSVDGAGGDSSDTESDEHADDDNDLDEDEQVANIVDVSYLENRHLTEPDSLFIESLMIHRRSMSPSELAEYDAQRSARVNAPPLIGPIDSLARHTPWTNQDRIQALHVLTQTSDKDPFGNLPEELKRIIISHFNPHAAIRVRVVDVWNVQDRFESFYIKVFPDVDTLIAIKTRIINEMPRQWRHAWGNSISPHHLVLQFGHRRVSSLRDDSTIKFLQHFFEAGGDIRVSIPNLGPALSQMLIERRADLVEDASADADLGDAEEEGDDELSVPRYPSTEFTAGSSDTEAPGESEADTKNDEPPTEVVDVEVSQPVQLSPRQVRLLAAERRAREARERDPGP